MQAGEHMAIFEGADFALVDVDDHVARPGLRAHGFPFAPGWKTCATQAAQVRGFQLGQHLVGRERARQQALQLRQFRSHRLGQLARSGFAARQQVVDRVHAGMGQLALAHTRRRRLVALADARRGLHPHGGVARQPGLQIAQQGVTTRHGT